MIDIKKLKRENIIYLILLTISVTLYFTLNKHSMGILIVINLAIVTIFLKSNFLKDVFSIKNLFLINYLIYVLYVPIKLLNPNYNGEPVYHLTGSRGLSAQIVLICGIIATLSFIVGYKVMEKNKTMFKIDKFNFIRNLKDKSTKFIRRFNFILNVKMLAYTFTLVGTFFFVLAIIKQGGVSYLFSEYIWNSENSTAIGMMTTGLQLAFVGVAISFYELVKSKKVTILNILKWPSGYIFLFISLIKFMQGGRIQVLMGGITLVLIYNYAYKKIKVRYIVLFAILAMIAMGYIGYFRDYKTLIPSDFKTMMEYMLGKSAGMEYILNSYTNYTTMNIINNNDISFLWGTTIIDGLIFLIPRAILPNKDQLLFTNNKLNELNQIEVISPVGGLNLAAQNLLNGYVVYTIIFMAILGAMFYWLDKYKKSSKDGKLLYCMMVPYLVISMIRNPIFYTIKEVLQFAIVPYLIYMILQLGEKDEKGNL